MSTDQTNYRRAHDMRVQEPVAEAFVEHRGVKLHYEVYGEGSPTILLLPTWTVIHKLFWRLQVPYLARRFRVISFDGPGNGLADRPTESAPYEQDAQTSYALAVLDATETDRAVIAGLSMGANRALDLAANHSDRVLGTIFIAPALPLTDPDPQRAAHTRLDGPLPAVEPSNVPKAGEDPQSHWAKFNRAYWHHDYEDFLWFFFGQCFSETRSIKHIEDFVGWGLDTSAAILAADTAAAKPDATTVRAWCARVASPTLVIHGDDDRIHPVERGRRLAELTRGQLLVLQGSGHLPLARDPVPTNLAMRDFVERLASRPSAARSWPRAMHRSKRVLFVPSPGSLDAVERDRAIARALRAVHPDVSIEWLVHESASPSLRAAGEAVHPASRWMAGPRAGAIGTDDDALHDLRALRSMDEIHVANFMLFHEVAEAGHYDLVIADKAWQLDHYLHHNPELKRFAYVWLTDVVGWLPGADGGEREAVLAGELNAEMIEQIARFPRVRDRAIFVGDPDDVVADRFGPELPSIREWTEANYTFCGYVGGSDVGDREALRHALGYGPEETVCIVDVGASQHVLRQAESALPAIRARVPDLRMVVITAGGALPTPLASEGSVDVRTDVADLRRHLAACDVAIVEAKLAPCMELTARRRPFLYVPATRHAEQCPHVAHRLRRYRAGRRLDVDEATGDRIADLVVSELQRDLDYRPVDAEGAGRAAALIAELL